MILYIANIDSDKHYSIDRLVEYPEFGKGYINMLESYYTYVYTNEYIHPDINYEII